MSDKPENPAVPCNKGGQQHRWTSSEFSGGYICRDCAREDFEFFAQRHKEQSS